MEKSHQLTPLALPRSFFERSPELVARQLLGAFLVRRLPLPGGGTQLAAAGRVVETEAYLGTGDEAAHAFRGPTPRNAVLFGPAGHAYVYLIYGMYSCLNVSCEPAGAAGCVLLRALEPVTGLEWMAANRHLAGSRAGTHPPGGSTPARQLSGGPGRLCQALAITRAELNGADMTNPASALYFASHLPPGLDPTPHLAASPQGALPISVTARIGIRRSAHLPLRFHLSGHPAVSTGPHSKPENP